MLKLILGVAIWAVAQKVGLRPLWMILGFGATALVVQVTYTHALNDCLGGDPVSRHQTLRLLGIRNLDELHRATRGGIPRVIWFLDTLAKALAYAAFGGILLGLGWI